MYVRVCMKGCIHVIMSQYDRLSLNACSMCAMLWCCACRSFWLKPWLLGFGAAQHAGLLRGSIGPNASTQSYILSFGGTGYIQHVKVWSLPFPISGLYCDRWGPKCWVKCTLGQISSMFFPSVIPLHPI